MVVREVGVGIAAAPHKLQDDHARGANGFSQHMDIGGDDSSRSSATMGTSPSA